MLRLGAPRERPICGIHQGSALLLGFCQKPEALAMVEGRLVGPQFTEAFGLVEDGGDNKTYLGHEVMLKDDKLKRQERKEVKK